MTISSSRSTDLLSWWQIIRLGLIQTALGGIVVLTTSTLNRIMVVEMALAASLPGFLVTIHHAVQLEPWLIPTGALVSFGPLQACSSRWGFVWASSGTLSLLAG